MDGRIAARTLALNGYECPHVFDVFRTEKDVWLSADALCDNGLGCLNEIDEPVEDLLEKVRKGIEAERIDCTYNDFLFTNVNLDLPSDANSETRNEAPPDLGKKIN